MISLVFQDSATVVLGYAARLLSVLASQSGATPIATCIISVTFGQDMQLLPAPQLQTGVAPLAGAGLYIAYHDLSGQLTYPLNLPILEGTLITVTMSAGSAVALTLLLERS